MKLLSLLPLVAGSKGGTPKGPQYFNSGTEHNEPPPQMLEVSICPDDQCHFPNSTTCQSNRNLPEPYCGSLSGICKSSKKTDNNDTEQCIDQYGRCIDKYVERGGVMVVQDFCQNSDDHNRLYLIDGIQKFTTVRVTDKYYIPYFFYNSRDRVHWNNKRLDENVATQAAYLNEQTCLHVYEGNNHTPNIPAVRLGDFPSRSGCNSPVGRSTSGDGYNDINLGTNCDFTFVHELFHSLGAMHEQTRPDRGSHSVQQWGAHDDTTWAGQWIKGTSANENFGFEYDFNSEMHYSFYDTVNGVRLPKVTDLFGHTVNNIVDGDDPWLQAHGGDWTLSTIDKEILKRSYSCQAIEFPRGKIGTLSSGTFSIQGKLNDDDTWTTTSGAAPAFEGQAVGFVFADSESFNIHSLTTHECYKNDGNTKIACDLWQALSDSNYQFKFKPIYQSVIFYDENTNECYDQSWNVISCSMNNPPIVNSGFSNFNCPYDSNKYTYTFNGQTFIVIDANDVCGTKNGYCSHTCSQNGQNPRICSCPNGWELMEDQMTCQEINECDSNPCPNNALCLNMYGAENVAEGYRCRCEWGKVLKNNACISTNEEIQTIQWYRFKDDNEDMCLSFNGGIKMETCDAGNRNQYWQMTADGYVSGFADEKPCIDVSAGGDDSSCDANLSGYTSQALYTSTGDCQVNRARNKLAWFANGVFGSLRLSDPLCGSDKYCVFPYVNNQAPLLSTCDGPWQGRINWERESVNIDVILGFMVETSEVAEYTGTVFQTQHTCVGDFERPYKYNPTDGSGSNGIVCINHQTGVSWLWMLSDGSKTDFTPNNDCIGDPIHMQVFTGNFADGVNVICVDKRDDQNIYNIWCNSALSMGKPEGQLKVGEVTGDQYTDFICHQHTGVLKVWAGAANLDDRVQTQQNSGFTRNDWGEFDVADMNNDGLADLIYFERQFDVIKIQLQQAEFDSSVAAPAGSPCPGVDSAVNENSLSSCEYWVGEGYCSHTYVSFMVSNCAKQCGLCVGSEGCTNEQGQNYNTDLGGWYNCLSIVADGRCDQAGHQCQLACGQCTPSYPQPEKPWLSPTIIEPPTTKFCWDNAAGNPSSIGKTWLMDDFNNDGKTDFGCYDWEDGRIRYSSQVDGFTFSSTVLETNVGWCKSNYQNNLDEYVTMVDQASGQYMSVEYMGQRNELCISKSGNLYSTVEFNFDHNDPCFNHDCDDTCDGSSGQKVCVCTAENENLNVDGKTCDIDHCFGHDCDDVCTSFDDSYTCSCSIALFVLGTDGKSCIRNPCLDFGCSDVCNLDTSTNTPSCSCHNDRLLSNSDSKTCFSDPCLNVCLENGTCDGTSGNVDCVCDDGFVNVDNNCSIDLCFNHECSDSCEQNTGNCLCTISGEILADDGKTCIEIGSCHNHTCSDVCLGTADVQVCACSTVGNVLASDLTTCVTNLCPTFECDQFCSMESDGQAVCSCGDGFTLKVDGKTCQSNNVTGNECDDLNCSDICAINPNGLAYCACHDGRELIDDLNCQDIEDPCSTAGCNQLCETENGVAVCGCKIGFTLADDGQNCEEVESNPCENNICSDICAVNDNGEAYCVCFENREPIDANTCQDIVDLCSSAGCDHLCNSENGVCGCEIGFTLAADEKTCIEAGSDPCQNNDCSDICAVDANGQAYCACEQGRYLNDTVTCIDEVDACVNAGCDHICRPLVSMPNVYECGCRAGFTLQADGMTCLEISTGNPCENTQCSDICAVNDEGNVFCACFDGRYLENDFQCVEETDVCSNSPCQQLCVVSDGGAYECGCKLGFTLAGDDHTCTEIEANPCDGNECSDHCAVDDSNESYCLCDEDRELMPGSSTTCIDKIHVDPCMDMGCSDICEVVNTVPVCGCVSGYTLSADGRNCEEVDTDGGTGDGNPCAGNFCSDICAVDAFGDMYCTCSDGREFVEGSDTQCQAKQDPCSNYGCSHQCNVFNLDEATCSCPLGMTLDIDEKTCKESEICEREKIWKPFNNETSMVYPMRFLADPPLSQDYCFFKKYSGWKINQRVFLMTCDHQNVKSKFRWNEENNQLEVIGSFEASDLISKQFCLGVRNYANTRKSQMRLTKCRIMVDGVRVLNENTQLLPKNGKVVLLKNQNMCMEWEVGKPLFMKKCIDQMIGEFV